MIEITKEIVNKIINRSLLVSSIIAIPLNIIIWFALKYSEYQLPRYIPLFLGTIVIVLAFIRNKINLIKKTWALISVFFIAGLLTLLLGLLDMASLWFILAIIYTLFISIKNEAVYVFVISFLFTLITGILMITKISFIPIDYGFDNCQFACVAIRIFNFLFMGFLIYYILSYFFSTIKVNVNDLIQKSNDLSELNVALEVEMQEKKEIQDKMLSTVILTEEKERKRIASDLHDGLGPVLSAINLYFQAYVDSENNDKKEIQYKLQNIISDAISDVSRISYNISPHILENQGLKAALNNFISELSINDKISFDFQVHEIKRTLLQNELTVYRIILEMINNTLKHALATKVILKIENGDDNILKIYYSENGVGFDVKKAVKGMGLINIQNRVDALNGKLIISSKKNQGMKAEIEIPYFTEI